jgi:hypothetical protein
MLDNNGVAFKPEHPPKVIAALAEAERQIGGKHA